ncbi:MAG: prepilin peptidase [Planctomycetota bacterium]
MARIRRWSWTYLFLLLGLFFVLTLFALPLLMSLLVKNPELVPTEFIQYVVWIERLIEFATLFFMCGWVMFVGGTFASFLNVVAWRVPRGQSILGSSHCSYCATKLSFWDNLPFWGWLQNFGRCTTCGLPFSIRYFWVEVALGLTFLLIVNAVLLTGGATLPIRIQDSLRPLSRMLLDPSRDLLTILIVQLLGVLVIFTFALIDLERQRIPWSVFLTGVVGIAAFVIAFPNAILVSYGYPLSVESVGTLAGAMLTVVVGGIAGFAIGRILDALIVNTQPNLMPRLTVGLSIVGMVVGWQSLIPVSIYWILLQRSLIDEANDDEFDRFNYLKNLYWSPNAKLLAAYLIHFLTWRWFDWLS